ncbi:MAG: hypothetical protein HRT77_14865 [Halioglobus sp.]|nr:hypothetical protein [Halioglobus sp.]
MQLVKKTKEYSIYQRRDERYAVKDADKNPVNGEEKVLILVEEELIKVGATVDKPAEAHAVDEKTSIEVEHDEESAEKDGK